MSITDGCLGKYATPVPQEKSCPNCRASVEVFARAGRQTEDVVCPHCGYTLPAEPQPVFTQQKNRSE